MPLSLSTLDDQVGTCAGVLEPLFRLIETHVMAAGRLHGDDTVVPVLAKGQTSTGRVWVCLIVTAKLNDVDSQAWLADVLGRMASHPAQRLTELLPWSWTSTSAAADLDAAA